MPRKVLQELFIPGPRLNQVRILTLIASDPEITQSELAARCGLSVAMVNKYMKDFCTGGLLEYRRRSSKDISYHLEPAGRQAAKAGEDELLQELVRLFVTAKEKVWENIASQLRGKVRRVVVYGSGDLAQLAFHALEHEGISIVGVCDEDPSLAGREWCGRRSAIPPRFATWLPMPW